MSYREKTFLNLLYYLIPHDLLPFYKIVSKLTKKPRDGAKDKTAKFYSVFIFNTVSLNQYFKLLLFKCGLMSFLQAVTS